MGHVHLVWDLDDDPDGNVQHFAEHGITPEEVEEVLLDAASVTLVSRTTGNPITFGYTPAGRHIAVVWQHVMDDPLTMRPITAYEPTEGQE
jgi:hypothetical protein